MKFLCVCYYDAAAFAKFTEADFKQVGEICAPHDEAFKASGKVRLIGSLALPDQFRTMRADAKGVTVADGPYAETPEPFGAFFIIEAEDMDGSGQGRAASSGHAFGRNNEGRNRTAPDTDTGAALAR